MVCTHEGITTEGERVWSRTGVQQNSSRIQEKLKVQSAAYFYAIGGGMYRTVLVCCCTTSKLAITTIILGVSKHLSPRDLKTQQHIQHNYHTGIRIFNVVPEKIDICFSSILYINIIAGSTTEEKVKNASRQLLPATACCYEATNSLVLLVNL